MINEVENYKKSNIYEIKIKITEIESFHHHKSLNDSSLSLFIININEVPIFYKRNITLDEEFVKIDDFSKNNFATFINRHFILCDFEEFKYFVNSFNKKFNKIIQFKNFNTFNLKEFSYFKNKSELDFIELNTKNQNNSDIFDENADIGEEGCTTQ
jgi:hypothetical protein